MKQRRSIKLISRDLNKTINFDLSKVDQINLYFQPDIDIACLGILYKSGNFYFHDITPDSATLEYTIEFPKDITQEELDAYNSVDTLNDQLTKYNEIMVRRKYGTNNNHQI